MDLKRSERVVDPSFVELSLIRSFVYNAELSLIRSFVYNAELSLIRSFV